jgi:hypothetical protein
MASRFMEKLGRGLWPVAKFRELSSFYGRIGKLLAALIEVSGSFGAFFSLLAEVSEQPSTPIPDRYRVIYRPRVTSHSLVKNPHLPGCLLYLPRLLNGHQSGCEVNAILIGVIAITHPTTLVTNRSNLAMTSR